MPRAKHALATPRRTNGPRPPSTLELLERLSEGVDIPEEVFARVKNGTHTAEDVLGPLRTVLFAAFESLHDEQPFRRFSTHDHKLVHLRSCQKGRAAWTVTDVSVTADKARAGDMRWFVLREMQARARHVQESTIAALGIDAHVSIGIPRTHLGFCDKCQQTSVATSVDVVISWQGHTMKREYRL